ncbi:uncharacterized mitochondrial protein-like protein [Tanacetum coccineum]
MHTKFQMSSIGELTFFLGLQVTQKDDGIFISQDKYVDEILTKFGFLTVKTASTPMETSKPSMKDENAEDVDVHLYRSMIGSLMYLTSSRPDIMFAVCACVRFQVTPKVSHHHAMKRIFRYLKGQPKLGLLYPKDSPFDLEAYTDSDYASASLDRKSTTKVKNPMFHSKTKHIEIRHHFIRDSNEKKLIQMIKIHTDQNVADLLTKAFDVGRFQYLIASITYYCWATAGPVNAVRLNLVLLFWATSKAKTVNGEVQIQALVDGKKVIVTETSVRRALQLKDAEVFQDKQVEGMTKHKEIYVTPSHTKKVFPNMKRGGKGFSRRPQKKQLRRKQRKDTEVPQPSGSTEPITDEAANAEHVPTHFNNPFFSGEDRLKLNELMELCIKLSERVLDLENTKTSQAAEITKLKERIKKLERRNTSRTLGLKRLRKVGRYAQVVSSEDEGLGAQEDASKHERKINDLDADAEVTLVDEAQGRNDDNLMFNTRVLDEQEVETLIEIKAAKPKAVTTAATTTTTAIIRPKARGVVVQEPSEFRTTTSSQLLQAKDKGKAKMIEPEKPLKKKDQILIDEEIAQKHQAQLNAELEEEEKLAKQREEDENIVIGIIKKHFARLRAEEQRRTPLTKAQKRNQMCTYLKNMARFTHSQLKNKCFDEVQKAFDKTIGWIDSFVSMDSEVVKGGKEKDEGSKLDESVEVKVNDEAELKRHIEIVVDEEEIAVDAIPLSTKSPIIVDWKIIKKGKMGYFQLIRADGSSRRYSSMIKILQNIDREDLETLWKLVNAKHRNTRPEEAYERVLWGDLKVMFELDIESDVWINLQGHKLLADFKQQQSEMTNKIDTVLKAITDRITGALPSDTVKNSRMNVNSTSPVLSAREFQNDKPEEEEHKENDNPENINTNPSSPPDPSVSFITEKENDDSYKEEPEVRENAGVGELEVEYFDILMTRSELAYHKFMIVRRLVPSIDPWLYKGAWDQNFVIFDEKKLGKRGDGIAGIKRRRRDLSSDGVRNLATTSRRGRLKEDLESSTWRRRQDFKARPSQ